MENVNNKLADIQKSKEKLDFDYIYREYFSRVYKFCAYRVNNVDDAEDLTSEIFHKIYKNLNTFKEEKSVLAVWIFTIARNSVTDYYRRKSRHRIVSLDKFRDFFYSEKYVEDNLEKIEEKEYLRRAVSKLPDRERQIIAYKFGAELSNSEIAEIMNTSYENISVILHRSIKKLRIDMEEYYGK